MRTIDSRPIPPVGSIDLEHSLNYISLADVPLEFIYDKYTSGRLVYTSGSRPVLEGIACRLLCGVKDETGRVRKLADYIVGQLPWAGYYHKAMGAKLATNRNLVEEDLVASGYAWCNEQARVFWGRKCHAVHILRGRKCHAVHILILELVEFISLVYLFCSGRPPGLPLES